MPTKVTINKTIVPTDKAAILTKVTDIIGILTFLVSLSEKERKTIFKLGDKSLSFVEKVIEYATLNPSFVPSFIDITVLQANIQLFTDLMTIYKSLNPLTQFILDTATQVGSQIMAQAMPIYDNIHLSAKNDVAEARTIYEDLSARFPGHPKKKVVTPKPPTPPVTPSTT